MKHYLVRIDNSLRSQVGFLLRGFKMGMESAGCNREAMTVLEDTVGFRVNLNDERLASVLKTELSNYNLDLERVKNHSAWTSNAYTVRILDDENRMVEEISRPADMGENEWCDLIAYRIEELNKA